ncbi:MAG: hypothetical protein ACRDK3_13380 [Actinomycetota bacterium]
MNRTDRQARGNRRGLMESGDRAPDLRLTGLGGEQLRLSALRGVPVVITFLRYIG